MQKKFVPYLFLKDGRAVKDFHDPAIFEDGDPIRLARQYDHNGADELVVFDLSEGDGEHEAAIALIKEIVRQTDLPIMAGGHINRLEDVKKLIYAGARKVFLNFARQDNIELLEEASKRFGKNKMCVCTENLSVLNTKKELIEEFASEVLLLADGVNIKEADHKLTAPILPFSRRMDPEGALKLLESDGISGICCTVLTASDFPVMELKAAAKEAGLSVNTFESSLSFTEFKLNSDGLIPVITQDYKTGEVLMLAYMNREAFDMTIKTGRMTYYSRSRSELWVKGLTSGHFQYVKELSVDCDRDTLLARVAQIGAACHTGNRSCFYTNLVKKDYDDTNPMKVFENVFAVIEDRRQNPKEGSYTNYLFDKGIDKILKKVGEEATEIIIAAKNPDPEEIKYEISDFLYHVMVLMAEKGVTWEDITRELARR